jgi:hypothetical protein
MHGGDGYGPVLVRGVWRLRIAAGEIGCGKGKWDSSLRRMQVIAENLYPALLVTKDK